MTKKMALKIKMTMKIKMKDDDVEDKDDVKDKDDVEDKDDDAAIIEGEKGHCFGCRAAPSLICAALQSRSDY